MHGVWNPIFSFYHCWGVLNLNVEFVLYTSITVAELSKAWIVFYSKNIGSLLESHLAHECVSLCIFLIFIILFFNYTVSIESLWRLTWDRFSATTEGRKISISTQPREILCTDSHDTRMIVLSSTVALHYYNCFTDGNTSPRNYGYMSARLTLKL
jgi:hypothetical protein